MEKPNLGTLAKTFFWRHQSGKGRPDTRAAMDHWWTSELDSDSRQSRRAGYLAIKAQSPKGASEADQWKWWDSLGKDKRGKLREKYGYDSEGFFDSLLDVASVVMLPVAATRVALTPQGQAALNSVLPGTGTAIATGKKALKAHDISELADMLKTDAAKAALSEFGIPASVVDATEQDLKAVRQLIAAKNALSNGNETLAGTLAINARAQLLNTSPAKLTKLAADALELKNETRIASSKLQRLTTAQAHSVVKRAAPSASSSEIDRQIKNHMFLEVK